jgi:hypothetical protein
MAEAESKMLAYIKLRHEEGALSVSEAQILGAIIPRNQPELRQHPAYRYGLERLYRRLVINAIADRVGTVHCLIGDYPSAELRESLGL